MINQPTELKTIEINPSETVRQSIIWLHGLGADGHDFAPIAQELHLKNTRFIFPHAPFRPITINQGYVMRAWYDIVSMQIDKKVDETSINESIKHIKALVENEIARGVAPNQIILAGFSQGAVVALMTALSYPETLGGVLVLSGYLSFQEKQAPEFSAASKNTPIFIGHGTDDTIVPYTLGAVMSQFLKKHHYPVDMHTYSMGHSVCEEEVRDIAEWLNE